MRKFLWEMETVVTLDDVRESYYALEPTERVGMTFPQYLADCLGKNGALTEILTDETPRGEQQKAVCNYAIQNPESGDVWEEWLTPGGVNDRKSDGYDVVPTCKEDYV